MSKATVITAPNMQTKSLLALLSLVLVALALFMGTAFAGSPSAWQNQELKVKGTWMIEERADGNYLVLSEDFKTKNAPDLKFFVTKNTYGAVTGDNATNGAVQIAKLNKNKGGQSYKIPASVNLDDYQSLVLHCEQYSKLWASTPLK